MKILSKIAGFLMLEIAGKAGCTCTPRNLVLTANRILVPAIVLLAWVAKKPLVDLC